MEGSLRTGIWLERANCGSAKPTAFCDEMASSVDVGTAMDVDHCNKAFESPTVSSQIN